MALRAYVRAAMLAFPSAKINLGLNVMERLPDGYHTIETVLLPIPLFDALEVVVDPSLGPAGTVLVRTGIAVPGRLEDDLCLKAVHALRALRPLPGLRVHLHKAIPIGAGLGGGSSDGTRMLMLLNDLLHLGISADGSRALAATLGSDCPFFVDPRPQLAEGRGERLRPIDPDLRGQWLVLVNPGIHVPTAEVYRNTKPTGRSMDLAGILSRPMADWQGSLVNVMEEYVFARHPEVGTIKRTLLEAGAAYAAMSGSGSSVFGLFPERPAGLTFPTGHSTWTLRL